MLIDLAQTTTRDGVRLDGMLQLPSAAPTLGLCLVHGTGGNFYSSTLFDALAERLLALDAAVLRVNTRGHDGISTAVTERGGRRLGAAYEVVDDCRHDLAAWVAWLRGRTGVRVGLIGHSLGAVKSLYAAAHEPQLDVGCVVAISPPRLSYGWFCSSPQAALFLEDYARAEQMVQAGQPAALLEVRLPLPMMIAAAGYLEKYGPEERYDYLNFVATLRCPTLVALGSIEVENNMAFHGAPEALATVPRRSGRLDTTTIAGADHSYSSARPALLDSVASWLRGAVP